MIRYILEYKKKYYLGYHGRFEIDINKGMLFKSIFAIFYYMYTFPIASMFRGNYWRIVKVKVDEEGE